MAIRGILLALIMLMGVAFGFVFQIMQDSAPVENNPPAKLVTETALLEVRTEVYEPQTLERVIELAGQTEANRRERILAQSGGTVSQVLVDKGEFVEVGQLVGVISAQSRSDNLEQAQVALERAQIDYDATKRLVDEGFAPANNLVAAEAQLESAKAQVAQASEQLDDLNVYSSISGIVEERQAQEGSFIGSGDPVISVTSLNPLKITADAGERNVAQFSVGQEAKVLLATGQEVAATISYISPFADRQTRTFNIEAEAPNDDNALFEGVTATVSIVSPSEGLHYVPTGLLQRAPDGRQGLFSVGDENKVVFNPVTIVSADDEGSWVDGLEGAATLIVNGQASVRDGQEVIPVASETVEQITAAEASQ